MIEAAQRQAKAVELRLAGYDYATIAKHCGYSDQTGAYQAVLAALRNTRKEPADELRQLECDRLDKMLRGAWLTATKGDPQAIYACLAIMDRRAKLLGLWSVTQIDIRVQIEQMAAALGLDPAEAVAEAERIIRGSKTAAR